ncbi:hypothetical protein ACFQV4_22305 [Streptomyces thermocarboxydus]
MADARTGLERLTQALAGYRVDSAYEAEYREGKERWDAVVEAALRADDDTAVPTQTQVLGALDAVVGDDDVVINAAGSLPGDLHKLWRARSPASTTWSTATPAWATRSRPRSASSRPRPARPSGPSSATARI